MNLLFILPEIKGGGIASYYRNLLGQIDLQQHQVKIILAQESEGTVPSFIEGIPIQGINRGLLEKYRTIFNSCSIYPLLKNSLCKAWAIFEQVSKEQDWDLVELTDYPLLFIPWIIKQDRIPVVIRLAGSQGQIEFYERRDGQYFQTSILQNIEQQCFQLAEGIIALSDQNKMYWADRLGNKIEKMTPYFSFPFSKDGGENNSSSNAALVLGRVQTWKGAEELCRAATILGESCPLIEWFGGNNYYRNHSTSMSTYLSEKYPIWGSRIVHKGKIPYQEAQEKLAGTKFLIVPSTWDTFNFTVIEAMAQGKVVICSDGAGASEHIQDGFNGWVYLAKDAHALADKIRIVENMTGEEKKRMGENARKTILEVFSSEIRIEERMDLYKRLVNIGPRLKNGPELTWLKEWLSPEAPDLNNFQDTLLDRLTLKELMAYIKVRIQQKLSGGVRK